MFHELLFKDQQLSSLTGLI